MADRERLEKARQTLDKRERELAVLIAENEKDEQALHKARAELKKLRAELEDKKERLEDNPNRKREGELVAEIFKLEQKIDIRAPKLAEAANELSRATVAEEEAQGRVEKARRRVKKLAKELRNSVRPKVVDLGFNNSSSPMGPIKGSVGHYTAGAYASTDEQAVRLWQLVRQQHLNQGWSEIGYHIGLGPEGGIYLLRKLQYAGAHTLGYNTGYVGFSVHGTTGDTWTTLQLRAFRSALSRFGLAGKPVWGHNDFNATACPGDFKHGYVSKGR